MTKQLQDALDKLSAIQFDSDCIQELEEITKRLRSIEDSKEAIESVFRFIEANEDKDLGSPGPLVHWLEEFYGKGYEKYLLESIKRKATPLNTWMLNRLINDAEGSGRQRYISVMRAITVEKSVSEEVRELALRFLS